MIKYLILDINYEWLRQVHSTNIHVAQCVGASKAELTLAVRGVIDAVQQALTDHDQRVQEAGSRLESLRAEYRQLCLHGVFCLFDFRGGGSISSGKLAGITQARKFRSVGCSG